LEVIRQGDWYTVVPFSLLLLLPFYVDCQFIDLSLVLIGISEAMLKNDTMFYFSK